MFAEVKVRAASAAGGVVVLVDSGVVHAAGRDDFGALGLGRAQVESAKCTACQADKREELELVADLDGYRIADLLRQRPDDADDLTVLQLRLCGVLRHELVLKRGATRDRGAIRIP